MNLRQLQKKQLDNQSIIKHKNYKLNNITKDTLISDIIKNKDIEHIKGLKVKHINWYYVKTFYTKHNGCTDICELNNYNLGCHEINCSNCILEGQVYDLVELEKQIPDSLK